MSRVSRTLALFAACILLAVLICFLLQYLLHPRGEAVTGEFIAAESSAFLAKWDPKGQIPAEVQCGEGTDLSMNREGELPSHAWRALAFASRYRLTNDSALLSVIADEFDRMREDADGESELESLWQTYAVYEMTGDVSYLSFFLYGTYVLPIRLKGTVSDDALAHMQPMVLGNLLRGALLGLRGLSLENAREAFNLELNARALKYGGAAGSLDEAEFRGGQQRLDEQAHRLYAALSKEGYFEGKNQTDVTLYRQCWKALGAFEMYRTFGDAQYIERTNEILQSLRFLETSKEDFKFITLQHVLPCIEVLATLATSDPAYEASRDAAIEKLILPSYNGAKVGICGQGGGFVAGRSINGTFSGGRNIISTADVGWLTYIFSLMPAWQFEVGRRSS